MNITYQQIISFFPAPCYDPVDIGMPTDYSDTLVNFIKEYRGKVISEEDIQWTLLRNDFLTDQELRLYSVWCARQVQHLMTDQRSIEALNVAEKYAFGQATEEKLAAALAAAAGVAAWAAAWAAARAAAREAAGAARAAAAAARAAALAAAAGVAAREAAGAAAWAAALAAGAAALAAAAARESIDTQIDKLLFIFECKQNNLEIDWNL